MIDTTLTSRRVLVTGGSGVIGRELLEILCHREVDILSTDRHPLTGDVGKNVRHLTLDLAVDDLDLLREFRPHVIFHLAAAFERAKESAEFWTANWRDNTLCSHRVVDLARALPEVERFVFASSYLIYDPSLYMSHVVQPAVHHLHESDPVKPRNLCGRAKFYTEGELEFVREVVRSSFRTVCARIYRVYGRGSRDVVSRWIQAALTGEPIEVYNPENRYDYIFAGDVAEGLVRLAECPTAAGPVNLGSGRARSIQDVLDTLQSCMSELRSLTRSSPSGEDFEASCADITRLQELTSWTPPTSLEEGIRFMVEFERARVTS